MLRFLTDSHVPPAVALAARKLGRLQITPLREWHGGIHLHEEDPRLLQLAWDEGVTIVTYDLNTFPLHLKKRLEMGLNHPGVVYVSAPYRQNDAGGIARGLVHLWNGRKDFDRRIVFSSWKSRSG
jgi:hypothetical protein